MTTRRKFLRGLATTMSLPMLESFGHRAFAKTIEHISPARLGYVYLPNGVNVAKWFPTTFGKDYQLSDSLSPLEKYKESFHILSGLTLDSARAHGNGPGDHARANACFLTGVIPNKTAGADIKAGISADQIAAQVIGDQTRLSSLELSTDSSRQYGECDSGYSCAYQYNIAWRDERTPAPAMRDPRLVFENIFGSGNAEKDAHRRQTNRSVIDYVLEDAKRLRNKGSVHDKNKLDQFFTSVREIEKGIEKTERIPAATPNVPAPSGIPDLYTDHVKMMYDMMVLAFQTDSTRVCTFMLAHDGSNRTMPEIGINTGHHKLSHHKNREEDLKQIAKIDKYYAAHFAYFLNKMRSIEENDSTLLDNSMIVYGGGISDGNRHNHEDLPVILAGGGGGQTNQGLGRHTQFEPGTPLTNLHLSLLHNMGVNVEKMGDSTGLLSI